MGANAVTTVPVYVSGEVLTAADLNITNSGIPVFASTVERDAAFGGTGEKVLAEGQFAFLEDSNTTQFYDGASWQPVNVSPGLVLVKSQTIDSAVASVAITDAFSATYDNYLVTINGGVASTDTTISMILGASTTTYYQGRFGLIYTGGGGSNGTTDNGSNWVVVSGSTSSVYATINLSQPFLAKTTFHTSSYFPGSTAVLTGGEHRTNTSYSGFTFTPFSGTLTGGTIRVYGYAIS